MNLDFWNCRWGGTPSAPAPWRSSPGWRSRA